MVWDFAEANPIGGASGDIGWALDTLSRVLDDNSDTNLPAKVLRGTATALPFEGESLDAVITDPPYYDSVTYSNLSDFFYVWLKRSIGELYPDDFAANLTPKRNEAIAAFYRHQDSREKARTFYEAMMVRALQEAHRVLRSEAPLIMIYAHKTTAGWATLVDGLRSADFEIYESWPLETELRGGLRLSKAMLASSIFLVARKRDNTATGNYENEVQPELAQIVRERVGTLWEMGITGADLVIACVGAGLRAFTRFARVEYANGEEVPAERFLTEVETVVLETILSRLSREVGGKQGLASVDPATRFYILWRYTYRSGDLDAGEAIIFANGTHVELAGLGGLSSGARPLLEKEKGSYRLLDYTERGDDKRLGMPSDDGQPAPLIDALQRTLWLKPSWARRNPSRRPWVNSSPTGDR
jgi:putative DNA methylase